MNDSETTILNVEAQEPVEKMTKAELLQLVAKLEAEKAELKAAAVPTTAAAPTFSDSPEGQKAWLDERVPFKAIKDAEHYKDDVVVLVNGVRYQIQRGKVVMIPRFVYLAIDDAERQMADSSDVIQAYADQTEARFELLSRR